MKSYLNLVNGEWKGTSQTITIKEPATGKELGTVPAMEEKEIEEVMQSARQAQKEWQALAVVERAQILHQAAQLLKKEAVEIGTLLSKEIAKSRAASIQEVERTADLIAYTAEEGCRMEGQILEGGSFSKKDQNKIAFVHKEAMGVVLAIAPFNYPVNLAASKIAPALIGGNTVVFKTPTQGAISGLQLARIFHEAGVPAGVLNTVTGRGSVIGDALVTHPEVDAINFTGSTEIGTHIAELAGMKPCIMELGGKDAALVLEDAALENAAKEIVAGAFQYSGQRCTAIKRVFVTEKNADALVAAIQKEMETLSVGLPEENADITPLIDRFVADHIEFLIEDALLKGAVAKTKYQRERNLIWPMLLDQVTVDMDLAWEEPFGPVLPILRVKDVEEMIRLANDSEYGLQSAIFTNNYPLAMEIGKALKVGTVHMNHRTQRGADHFPFLGIKNSGLGVQGIKYSIDAMMRMKSFVFER